MLKMEDSTLASIRTYLGFHWIRMHGSTQTHFMPSADFFKSQTHIGTSCWHILGFYVTLIKLMLPYQEIFAFRLQDITIFVKGVFNFFHFLLLTLHLRNFVTLPIMSFSSWFTAIILYKSWWLDIRYYLLDITWILWTHVHKVFSALF